MKFALTFFSLSLLLTACSKHQTDNELRRKIVGTWIDANRATWTIESNGNFVAQATQPRSTLGGMIRVNDGFLLITVLKMPPTHKIEGVGWTVTNKIIRVNDSEFIFSDMGGDDVIEFKRSK